MWTKNIGYEIQELLGEGGQGQVFKALRQDPATGMRETVAIKILHSETAVELWRREFESLRRVRSPFCVQVFAFERIDGRPALILEYIDGVSLNRLSQSAPLKEAAVSEILRQLESAVLDLAGAGVFHGDLSPHNVLVDTAGNVRLLDFGFANSTRLTPDFAAPERMAGEPAGLAADLFSIGRIEQFLRGEKFAPDDSSIYLSLNPAARSLRRLGSDQAAREELGEHVRWLQERRRFQSTIATRTVFSSPPRRRPAFWALAFCFFISASSASVNFNRRDQAWLQIRTHRWHYLILDGTPIGYSPVSIPLSAGPHRLEWASARGKGVKTVRPKPNRVQVLSDRDFSH